jgi:glutathione S-transferase
MSTLPILYSFRRCPYAMRARMALYSAGCTVVLREVLLRDKPQALRTASAKATVPVLVLPNGAVIDESMDIMHWALAQIDSHAWLTHADSSQAWVTRCDSTFKPCLDRYKYADRHPEKTELEHRQSAENFIDQLEQQLMHTAGLIDDQPRLADVAVFPFVRQFAAVDPNWWQSAPYPKVRAWLEGWLHTPAFSAVMTKYAVWQPNAVPVHFP